MLFSNAWLSDASSVIAAIVISWLLTRRRDGLDPILERLIRWERRPVLLCLAIACLPPLLRLALVPWFPIPHPFIHDEFGHLLVADTLASGRLANPPHPFYQHLETIYVLQRPTYSSIYPLGQGVLLALGQVLLGHPWFAVVAAEAVMNVAVFWALLALVPTRWAAVGCLIASLQLGIMSYWMNTYWGGTLAAIAGCLVFGGIFRFLGSHHWGWGALSGVGFAILWHIRPFETVWMIAGCVVYVFWRTYFRKEARLAGFFSFIAPVSVCLLLAGGVSGYHNFRVTGNVLTMPYQLSQQEYGVPVGLIWSSEPPKPEFSYQNLEDMYQAQHKKRRIWTDWNAFRKEYSGRFQLLWLIYVSPALTIPFIAAFWFRSKVGFPVLGFLILGFLPTNLYVFLNAHYLAGYTPLAIAFLVLGLKALWESPARLGRLLALASILGLLIVTLTKLSFLFRLAPENWQPHGDPWSVAEQLRTRGGKHLVLVRYSPHHDFRHEWVYNRANIDRADVVWAREVSPEKDRALIGYFRDRQVWVLDADKWPPTPAPYRASPSEVPNPSRPPS